MVTSAEWILYGANGYTGELIAREAVQRGMRPILAGRTAEAIEKLAAELGRPSRVFSLDDPLEITRHLKDASAVLNCAGPFAMTAEPMMDACLQAGVHYLDITGEIDVIEAAALRHERAVESGVVLMPAVGFDVVPSDCLAAMVAEQLPGATHLELAISGLTRVSPGTAKTMALNMPQGGRIRAAGEIQWVPVAWKAMDIPFRSGTKTAMTIPWGDVASAFYSTGIPNVEVYAAFPQKQINWLRRVRPLVPVLKLRPLKSLVSNRIDKKVKGPSADERGSGRASLWCRVSTDDGRSVEGTLETPDGYAVTIQTSVAALDNLLQSPLKPGYYTPSKAFGSRFILQIPGCDFQLGSAAAEAPVATAS